MFPDFIGNKKISVDWLMMLLTLLLFFLFQIANLEQQVRDSSERMKSAEQQITEKQQHMDKLVSTVMSTTVMSY